MSACYCYYIEVPNSLATSEGQQLYVVYTDCNGVLQNTNTAAIPTIDLGSSFAFYVCSYLGATPQFKYGFFGDIEFIVISKMYQVYCKFLKCTTPGLYLFFNVIFSFLLKLPLTGFKLKVWCSV